MLSYSLINESLIQQLPGLGAGILMGGLAVLFLSHSKVSQPGMAPNFTTEAPTLQKPAGQVINIDGSSTVYPITNLIAIDYEASAQRSRTVDVKISGTGKGFKKFCNGELDIANASRPMTDGERETCANQDILFVDFLIAYDGITVVVNPKNDWVDQISLQELKYLWSVSSEKSILRWDQIRPAWPKNKFELVGPGSDSGTFDVFNELILGEGDSRSDYRGSENDEVLVNIVKDRPNALGYFGYGYYLKHQDQLKVVPIEQVLPSQETIRDRTYPLARPLFIYVNSKSLEQGDLFQFVSYFLKHAQEAVQNAGFVPLLPEDYKKSSAKLESSL